MTTFNNIDNIFRIAFRNTTFHIEMAKDSLYRLSKELSQQILTCVNNISQRVKVEKLSRSNEVTLTLCVATPISIITNEVIKISFNCWHAINYARC